MHTTGAIRTLSWYIKIHGHWLSFPKGNNRLEILLAQIFNLKQKINQVPPASVEKKICLQENSLVFLQTISSSFV